MRILIVDDHLSLQTLLTMFLEDAGYSVAAVNNGSEALNYLRRCRELPSLILLDVAMPKMTGWEFLRQQREDKRLADIPVVLMSALHRVDCDELAPSAAATITKPMDLLELQELLQTHCHPQPAMRTVGA